jgi:hypothetical protein
LPSLKSLFQVAAQTLFTDAAWTRIPRRRATRATHARLERRLAQIERRTNANSSNGWTTCAATTVPASSTGAAVTTVAPRARPRKPSARKRLATISAGRAAPAGATRAPSATVATITTGVRPNRAVFYGHAAGVDYKETKGPTAPRPAAGREASTTAGTATATGAAGPSKDRSAAAAATAAARITVGSLLTIAAQVYFPEQTTPHLSLGAGLSVSPRRGWQRAAPIGAIVPSAAAAPVTPGPSTTQRGPVLAALTPR